MLFARARARRQSRLLYKAINRVASPGQRDELIVMAQRAESH